MKTILLVEDAEELAGLLSSFLGDSGYGVVCVSTAKQALQAMDVVRPDLVLCDVVLPDLDGLSFCRTLNESSIYSGVPVVLMTALSERLNLESCPHATLIRKPFDIDKLLLKISELTDHRK